MCECVRVSACAHRQRVSELFVVDALELFVLAIVRQNARQNEPHPHCGRDVEGIFCQVERLHGREVEPSVEAPQARAYSRRN